MSEGKRVVVIGGGPAGYPAAFGAADAGMQVTLIEQEPFLGGVCLHRGCIPSKTLLHMAHLIAQVREVQARGVQFGAPTINAEALRNWKNEVIRKLAQGLGGLAKQRHVEIVRGRARFRDARTVEVTDSEGTVRSISFDYAVVATGSVPIQLKGWPRSERIWDSTAALSLDHIPARLLVVGAGYIGLELGSIYAEFGSKVIVVELMPEILPGVDRDLVKPLWQRVRRSFSAIYLDSRVTDIQEREEQWQVRIEGKNGTSRVEEVDRILVAVGRRPNSQDLGLEQLGIRLNDRGFIQVNEQRRTDVPHVFAIGDVAGEPLLAHKATHEARVAVEAMLGKKTAFDPRAIPGVVYTDPEIAWCGLTEAEASARGLSVRAVIFPWSASGRALTMGAAHGVTKLVCETESGRILGAGVCGVGAGELISECALAIEMGATAEDLAHTIHPHPTLSETILEAADLFLGHCVHLPQS